MNKPRPGISALIAAGIMAGAIASFFVGTAVGFIVLNSTDPYNPNIEEQANMFGVAAFLFMIGLLVAWSLWSRKRPEASKVQLKTYTGLSIGQGVDSATAKARAQNEPVFSDSSFEGELILNAVAEGVWTRYGQALTTREAECLKLARRLGAGFTRFLTDYQSSYGLAKRILPGPTVPRGWQVRNVMTFHGPPGTGTIWFADINSMTLEVDKVFGELHPRPVMTPGSFMQAAGAADRVLIVAPPAPLLSGSSLPGKKMKLEGRELPAGFQVRGEDPEWVRRALTPELAMALKAAKAELVIYYGQVSVASLTTWIEPAEFETWRNLLVLAVNASKTA